MNKIDNGSDMLMKKRFVLRWNVNNEEGSFECWNVTLLLLLFVRVQWLFCIKSPIALLYTLCTPGKNYFN